MKKLKKLLSFIFTSDEKKPNPAPIITDYYERGIEKEFRRPDDPENVIRINQKPPSGLPNKLYEYTSVSGVNQSTRVEFVKDFINGKNRSIELLREPENLYDKNAVKVIGHWTDKVGNQKSAQIGYLPAEIALKISKDYKNVKIGATIKALYRPIGSKSPGIRIDIWGPRIKKEDKVKKDIKFEFIKSEPDSEPGYFQGKHYTEYVEVVKDLKRANEYEKAEKLLLILIKAVEAESRANKYVPASWYYEQLAVIYRKQKLYDKEIAILEQYNRNKFLKDEPIEFIKRINKVKELKLKN